jgi:lysozyme family protein
MAAASYEEALRRVLAHEGGYSDHPADPGGPTNFGITLADYRKYVKPDATAADVCAMPVEEAKAIYRRRYWDAQACDDLPPGVDYAIFDYGVNSGIGRSGKVLRRCLGLRASTSRVKAEVVAAAKAADATQLIASICDERLRYLKSLETWSVFGRGWERRVGEVKRDALAMAAGPRKPTAPSSAKVGGAVATATAAATAAHQSGLPLWAVVAIALASAAAAGAVIHLAVRRKD